MTKLKYNWHLLYDHDKGVFPSEVSVIKILLYIYIFLSIRYKLVLFFVVVILNTYIGLDSFFLYLGF